MRVDRAARRIAATADRIYKALTDRAMVQSWLPPQGAQGIIQAFDARPGGAFRMTLVFDNVDAPGVGKSSKDKSSEATDVVDGVFVDLKPGRLVRQRFAFKSDDPAFGGEMTMTWTLTPMPGGTEVVVTAQDVPPGIAPKDHEAGMASSLANLARCVEHIER